MVRYYSGFIVLICHLDLIVKSKNWMTSLNLDEYSGNWLTWKTISMHIPPLIVVFD